MITVVPELPCHNAPKTVVTSSPAEIRELAAKCLNAMKIHFKNGFTAIYENIEDMTTVILMQIIILSETKGYTSQIKVSNTVFLKYYLFQKFTIEFRVV